MKLKARAPGRVNLIGEHTDYNQGFVLPAAIDLYLDLTCEPLIGRTITARAEKYGSSKPFSLDSLTPVNGRPAWIDYIKGVCWVLEKAGYRLTGADLSISSNIPVGSGLSSSAALELATARAMTEASGYEIEPAELALLCQKAENEFVGVQCGIMDQYAVALGRKNQALLLDCRSLDYSYIPLSLGENRVLIVDSRVERSLGASAYNRRREECEEAVTRLSAIKNRAFQALRDVTLEDLKEARPYLPELLYRRSRYVVEENLRVQEAAEALKREDLFSFGYFMKRSHAGLRDLYEVSSPELDLIVDTAIANPGVIGARMTGAGFGGCAVIIVDSDAVSSVKAQIKTAFADCGLKKPLFYDVTVANGAKVMTVA